MISSTTTRASFLSKQNEEQGCPEYLPLKESREMKRGWWNQFGRCLQDNRDSNDAIVASAVVVIEEPLQ